MLKKVLGCIGMITLFAILGWLVAFLLVLAYTGGAFNPWRAAPLPEDQAADHFSIAEEPFVYIRTTQGQVFAQSLDPEQPRQWEAGGGENPGEGGDWECWLTDKVWSTLYQPPGRIRERLECIYIIHDNREYAGSTTYVYRYAILENGDVWRWENFSSGWRSLAYFLQFSLFGIIGGALVGLLLFGLLLVLRASTSSNERVNYE
jgi:hypothetical protein